MEPRHLGFRGRGPEAILALLRRISLAIEEPEDDLLGVRRLDAERHPQVGMDPGISCALNVGGRGDGVVGLRILGPARGRGQKEGQQGSEPDAVHRWTSRDVRFKSHFDLETQMLDADHSNPSTVAARTIGAVRSLPFTSSMLAIVSFFPGMTVR